MSESKTSRGYSKGPWAEHGKGGCECGFIYDATGNIHIATAHDAKALGSDYYGSDLACGPDERAANARLIAAAPELLEYVRLRASAGDINAIALARKVIP